MDLTENFLNKARLVKEQQADFDNLQHSVSGVETGQLTKHGLNKNDIDPLTGKKKKDAIAEALQLRLEDMLLNPLYRQAHETLMTGLRETQNAAQSALERVTDELSDARSAMNDLLSNAAKLPDGIKVFRDKDGQVRNEDGEIIPPEQAATIEWRGDEPSYEDYITAKERIESLEAAEQELRGIEAELGDIHERANDNNNPLTLDGLDKAQNRVDGLKDRIQGIENNVSNKMDKKSSAASYEEKNADLKSESKSSTLIPNIKMSN